MQSKTFKLFKFSIFRIGFHFQLLSCTLRLQSMHQSDTGVVFEMYRNKTVQVQTSASVIPATHQLHAMSPLNNRLDVTHRNRSVSCRDILLACRGSTTGLYSILMCYGH